MTTINEKAKSAADFSKFVECFLAILNLPKDARHPIIRIENVLLENFKNIEHGEITLNCEEKDTKDQEKSDILGIYGQNGSGKTAFIEALAILKELMSGNSIDQKFANCIAVNKELESESSDGNVEVSSSMNYTRLTFVFDIQYPAEHYQDIPARKATYSFCLKQETAQDDDVVDRKKVLDLLLSGGPINNNYEQLLDNLRKKSYSFINNTSDKNKTIVVFNEIFSLKSGSNNKQTVINTSESFIDPFGPETKFKQLASNKESKAYLKANKINARKNALSFIFMPETLITLATNCSNDILDYLEEYRKTNKHKKSIAKSLSNTIVFIEVLSELNYYAKNFLHAIFAESLTDELYLYNKFGKHLLPIANPKTISQKELKSFSTAIENTSFVLEQLVPGLTIKTKTVSKTLTKDGEPAENIIIVARREQKEKNSYQEFPLSYESYGVRRIISILNLIVFAFNNPSATVAIDEFDAGVYEYLLGEILQVIEEYGKGQFIFTSHNLRPLEVIDKKFLCFTTTDPQKKYCRLKNISDTNNLRDAYFREIIVNEQKEKLYERTKQFKIVCAFEKANGEV